MPGDIKVRVKWSVTSDGVEISPEHTGTMTIRPNSNFVWFVSDGGTYQTLVSRAMLKQAHVTTWTQHDQDLVADWINRGFRPMSYQGRLLRGEIVERQQT